MSEDRVARVSVRLLDREYQVACPSDERSDLLDSAEYLDAKMREVRDSGKVVGLDRIAVISALNIAKRASGAKFGNTRTRCGAPATRDCRHKANCERRRSCTPSNCASPRTAGRRR